MSSRNWLVRIQDIIDSTCTIRDCAAGLTFETFCENKVIVKAVLYDYMIIGEASKLASLKVLIANLSIGIPCFNI